MPQIFVYQGLGKLVRNDGCKFLLAALQELLCDATPEALGSLQVRLFKSDTEPDPTTIWADLTEADFDGYAAIDLPAVIGTCAGELEGPALDTDGEWSLMMDQVIFGDTGAVTPNLHYGWAITDANDNLLWIERFSDGPYTVDENGDQVKLTANLPLLPQGF